MPRDIFRSDESITICVTYECLTSVKDLRVAVHIVDEENRSILAAQNSDDPEELPVFRRQAGIYKTWCVIPPNTFGEKQLYVTVWLLYPKTEHLVLNKILKFNVKFEGYNNVQYAKIEESFLRPQLRWKTENLSLEQHSKVRGT
jgi:hypothetical protein